MIAVVPCLRLASLAVATVLPVAALAQQPAPAAPSTPAVAIAPMSCTNPGNVPKKDMDRFQKRNDEYRKCVMDYVESLRNRAVESANAARSYQDAANSEIEKYNNYINTINEQAKKQGG